MKRPLAALPKHIFTFCATVILLLFVLLSSSCDPCKECKDLNCQAKCGVLQDNVIDDEWIIRFAESPDTSLLDSLNGFLVWVDGDEDSIVSLDFFLQTNPPSALGSSPSGHRLVGWSQSWLDQLNQNFFRDASGNPAQLTETDVLPLRVCGCRMATFWINPIKVDLQSSITQSTSQTRTQDDGSPGTIISVDINRQVTFGPMVDFTSPDGATLSCVDAINEERKAYTFCELGTKAFPATPTTTPVTVAIIDSGMDWLHPWMGGGQHVWLNTGKTSSGVIPAGIQPVNLWPGILDNQQANDCFKNDLLGYDFLNNTNTPIDRQGHGTHVGGIIAQAASSVDKLELMPLKIAGYVMDAGQEVFTADLFSVLCAMEYAIDQNVDVINMSLGYYAESPNQQLIQLSNRALNDDILIVASVGNDTINVDCCGHWPSNLAAGPFPNVVSVAALDRITQTGGYALPQSLAPFSNYGNKALIAAPGVDINSALMDGREITKSGTSMAAAIISQQAAIIRANNPVLTAPAVRDMLLNGANSSIDPKFCTKDRRYFRYNDRSVIEILLPN